ncbi:MAG TPA: NAD-dependent epimerase/dehydratase family protein, partial [Bacillota bacterium]
MRVVVTGAAGFIGSNLVDALLARGGRVRGIDAFLPAETAAFKRANLCEALTSPRFELL